MNDTELSRALGRLEGKLDALMANQGGIAQRFSEHDNRIVGLEQDVASLRAGRSTSKSWLSTVISVVALGVAVISNFFFKGA